MHELSDRLRDLTQPGDGNDRLRAADELDRLEAEVERLREENEKLRLAHGGVAEAERMIGSWAAEAAGGES